MLSKACTVSASDCTASVSCLEQSIPATQWRLVHTTVITEFPRQFVGTMEAVSVGIDNQLGGTEATVLNKLKNVHKLLKALICFDLAE